MKHWLSAIGALALVLASAHSTRAQQEITLIAPNIMQGPFEELLKGYEAKTGNKVNATYADEDMTKQRFLRGEAFDVPILTNTGYTPLQEVTDSGKVVVTSGTPIAKLFLGVAVKKGAPKPDISTVAAVKQMLVNAKSITYPDLAAVPSAGLSANGTIKALGLEEQMRPKTKFGQGSSGTLALVARGDAEVGFSFLARMNDPGIDVVGMMPREISPATILIGYISTQARNPLVARDLLNYLASDEMIPIYRKHGIQPGCPGPNSQRCNRLVE
jgi:molybdate transport system substrate-binding protein